MPKLLNRLLRAACLLALVGFARAGVLQAQEAASAMPVVQRGPWEFAMQIGLTDFGVDQSAPGSMTTVGVGRRITSRFSIGLEGGLGSIETTGTCELGGLGRYECAQDSTWPSLGVDTRLIVFDLAGSSSRYYLVAQVLGHGPDFVASYDLGFGVSLRAVLGGDVGFEMRHRFGYDGASGPLYFFRLSR
jgi:hypothetical protein